jgi:hypothetical protein
MQIFPDPLFGPGHPRLRDPVLTKESGSGACYEIVERIGLWGCQPCHPTPIILAAEFLAQVRLTLSGKTMKNVMLHQPSLSECNNITYLGQHSSQKYSKRMAPMGLMDYFLPAEK